METIKNFFEEAGEQLGYCFRDLMNFLMVVNALILTVLMVIIPVGGIVGSIWMAAEIGAALQTVIDAMPKA